MKQGHPTGMVELHIPCVKAAKAQNAAWLKAAKARATGKLKRSTGGTTCK